MECGIRSMLNQPHLPIKQFPSSSFLLVLLSYQHAQICQWYAVPVMVRFVHGIRHLNSVRSAHGMRYPIYVEPFTAFPSSWFPIVFHCAVSEINISIEVFSIEIHMRCFFSIEHFSIEFSIRCPTKTLTFWNPVK